MGSRSSTTGYSATPTTATGPTSTGTSRHVGAPEVRHHPSAHHGRRPGPARQRRASILAGVGVSRLLRRRCCITGPTVPGATGTATSTASKPTPAPRRNAASRRGKPAKTGFPIRRRRDASTARDRLHAQPGADDRRIVSGQGPSSAVAMGRRMVPGSTRGRRHGQQPARVAVVRGCGTDAAPYFRVFNPTTQGEKFDPSGDYIRRWVPELRDGRRRPTLLRKGERPQGYPAPIVDHRAERAEALRRYRSLS